MQLNGRGAGPPGRSKGKGTDDPIRFLPVLPSKRTKPAWQQNPPTFELSGKILNDDDKNGIDLVGELTASKYSKFLTFML